MACPQQWQCLKRNFLASFAVLIISFGIVHQKMINPLFGDRSKYHPTHNHCWEAKGVVMNYLKDTNFPVLRFYKSASDCCGINENAISEIFNVFIIVVPVNRSKKWILRTIWNSVCQVDILRWLSPQHPGIYASTETQIIEEKYFI